MAAGHANAPLRSQLLAGLLHRIRTEPRRARHMKLLVASCLETLPDVPPNLAKDTLACLEDQIPPHDITAARSLAAVGEPVLERLPQTLNGLSTAASRATVRVAWLINGPKALSVLSRYANDARKSVQRELIEGWGYFDSDEYASRVLEDAPLDSVGYLRIKHLNQLRALRHLRHLRHLFVEPSVPDMTFLIGLRSLHGLTMGSVESGDLTPLAAHADTLTNLSIKLSQPIQDYDLFKNMRKLENLHLMTGVTDLDFVQDLPQLTNLGLQNLENITDFTPLKYQVALHYLDLWDCSQLSDIEELPSLRKLRSLTLTGSKLECGLEYLVAECPRVEHLFLKDSQWINDLTPLNMLTLRSLSLWECKHVDNLSAIAGQTQLTYLDLEATTLRDINPLRSLTNLRDLWLANCSRIQDLSPLAELRSLRTLHVEGISPDADLSPLAENRKLNLFINDGQSIRNLECFSKHRVVSIPRHETLF
jgi:hypothetical protein